MTDTEIPLVVAINEHGTIIGGDRLWRDGVVNSLRPLVQAVDLNDAGQVVGYCEVRGKATPCTWRHGRVERLPMLRGGDRGKAIAVNARGQIVGWSNLAGGHPVTHAVIWERGKISDLGTLGRSSQATDINNNGQATGWSTPARGDSHAVMWIRRPQ
jgi:probable HAF family extracellular repeat protein